MKNFLRFAVVVMLAFMVTAVSAAPAPAPTRATRTAAGAAEIVYQFTDGSRLLVHGHIYWELNFKSNDPADFGWNTNWGIYSSAGDFALTYHVDASTFMIDPNQVTHMTVNGHCAKLHTQEPFPADQPELNA